MAGSAGTTGEKKAKFFGAHIAKKKFIIDTTKAAAVVYIAFARGVGKR